MTDTTTQDPELLRPDDVQRILSVGKSTFWELIRTGRLPHIRVRMNPDGKRDLVRVPRQAIDDFVRANTVGGNGGQS